MALVIPEQKRKIGIMGGTFDPIHFGHLFIAEEARVVCGLEKVIFFPNNKPAHREGKEANAEPETRFELTQIGIAANPHFEISRIEIDREGPSYAYDTLQIFRREFGSNTELFFIMGADSIGDILTWYRGAELFDLCRFIATTRPDFDLEESKNILSDAQRERVTFLEAPGLHIASRELRRRVSEGQTIRYLTPDSVVQEIVKRGLYR